MRFKNPAYYLEVSEIIPIFAVETSLSAISYEDIAGIYQPHGDELVLP